MTVMFRKTTCQGCAMSQTTNVSYYLDKKLWQTTHTLEVCRERKALIAQIDFTKQGAWIKNTEILNSLN